MALIVPALSACGDGAARSGDGARKIKVVCTTTMIADLARELVGDDAQVISIMRPGEDPHIYDVRPRDDQMIGDADVVLYNGLHLEATLLDIIQHRAGSKAKVVALAEDQRIKPLGSADPGKAGTGAADPHCWFNIEHFQVYTQRARAALMDADPANAEKYRERANAYLLKLEELHAWTKVQIATVPREQRVMITSHDAFQYFGQAYDIEVHAVIGISTEQQAKPQDLERLERLVKDRNVRALFIETSVSKVLNDLVKRVAADSGAKIGGTLFSDSLDEPGKPAGTYVGMVKHNVTTVVEALK
ncbi:MAG: zinc ABC transporter substrate-binding protein [Phycisphaeraceae bacterium]